MGGGGSKVKKTIGLDRDGFMSFSSFFCLWGVLRRRRNEKSTKVVL